MATNNGQNMVLLLLLFSFLFPFSKSELRQIWHFDPPRAVQYHSIHTVPFEDIFRRDYWSPANLTYRRYDRIVDRLETDLA